MAGVETRSQTAVARSSAAGKLLYKKKIPGVGDGTIRVPRQNADLQHTNRKQYAGWLIDLLKLAIAEPENRCFEKCRAIL